MSNFSLAQKLLQSICVHTQERKAVKKMCQRILSHNLCCSVHTNDDKSAKINRAKNICSCKLACVSMPMLLDLILVKHFSPHV